MLYLRNIFKSDLNFLLLIMILEPLIIKFGYLALFIGVLLEGEVILILSGFLAHRGYLNIYTVILVAFIGTLISDQALFLIGYFKGEKFLKRFPKIERGFKYIHNSVLKREGFYIFIFRFLYGMRTISPLIIGSKKVKIYKFVIINLISAFVWAIIFSLGGYFMGGLFQVIIGKIKHVELELMIVIAIIFIVMVVIKKIRKK